MQLPANNPELYYVPLDEKILVYDPRKAKVNSILKKRYPEKEIVFKPIFQKVYSKFLNFVQTYDLFKPKERICIAWSGGKDSTALLLLMEPLVRTLGLEAHVATVDVRPNGVNIWGTEEFRRLLERYSRLLGNRYSFQVLGPRIFFAEKSICYICSALRREELTRYCKQLGASKLVLGHTLDDVLETIFIMAYKAKRLKLMSPLKFLSAKSFEIRGHRITWESVTLAKPMLTIGEPDIQEFLEAAEMEYFRDKLLCPHSSLRERTLRGKVDKLIKKMYEIDREYPYRFLESLNKSLK
jgi:tRNA 2-thiocytidine biosynthesis protein TtcA